MKSNRNSLSPTDRRLQWQTRSAILAFVAGFCVPPVGEISDSVLWVLSQCLIYAGSILGVASYVQQVVNNRLQRPRHTDAAPPADAPADEPEL